MIKIIEGNILNATEDIIGHQVNCQGVMGAGLAKQIKHKYPNVFDTYLTYCSKLKDKKYEILGKCLIIETIDSKFIANIFGQYKYGRNDRQTNYIALEQSLLRLKEIAYEHNKSIALPYGIGCGLAGGNWKVVYKIIEEVFNDYDVTLYKFK